VNEISLELGDDVLSLRVPERSHILCLPETDPIPDPAEAVRRALLEPIETPSLPDLIRQKQREGAKTAVVVISDNTRPVPYTGEQGILEPILDVLRDEHVEDVEILVANGTHHPLSHDELAQILPARALDGSGTVTNHVSTDRSSLRHIGRTARGTEAWINTRYLDADIRILTGLVEPHFMAGVSGGRKSICPGLIGEASTYTFHGAALMADPLSDSLILEGNPCHDEALKVARMAGADFTVNVTIDGEKRLTGVYCGELEQAHTAAAARVVETNAIRIRQEYDLVITHAGFAGINHYQAVKACVEAVKTLKQGGTLIVAANNTDSDPIGSENYKRVLPLLKQHGSEGITERLLSPDWQFIPEQWEVQMWARVLKKVGTDRNLIYCSPQLTGGLFRRHDLPGTDGGDGIGGLRGRELAENMVQRAIDRYVEASPDASIAILQDGPYGVPVLNPSLATGCTVTA